MPVALVTGIAGQDGFYLSHLLSDRGYTVHGLVAPQTDTGDVLETATLHAADLADPASAADLVRRIAPDHLYHLAGVSSVAASWADPVGTMAVNATAAIALLEAVWQLGELGHPVRFVQASSAEVFGEPAQAPQTERTPIHPLNPYGVSKAAAHHAVGVYRARGLHASSLILYNHESPRRPMAFVTRKISSTVAAIARGEATELRLGNLEARRDWGWAPDFVEAMHLAAAHPDPGDYVIATGTSHSVREFVAAAFARAGISDWERYVVVDPAFYRPADSTELRGDAGRARATLGWEPRTTFTEMVHALVDADL